MIYNRNFEGRISTGRKKGKPNIAPLQPPTLATFRSWGSSAGAGRAGLPDAKIHEYLRFRISEFQISRLITKYFDIHHARYGGAHLKVFLSKLPFPNGQCNVV
jgi:hypothetical protein